MANTLEKRVMGEIEVKGAHLFVIDSCYLMSDSNGGPGLGEKVIVAPGIYYVSGYYKPDEHRPCFLEIATEREIKPVYKHLQCIEFIGVDAGHVMVADAANKEFLSSAHIDKIYLTDIVESVCSDKGYGVLENTAVVSSTYYGDGYYPIYTISQRLAGFPAVIIVDFNGLEEEEMVQALLKLYGNKLKRN